MDFAILWRGFSIGPSCSSPGSRTGWMPRWSAAVVVPSLLALVAQVFWALAPYYLPATAIGFFVRLSLLWSLIAAMILFPDERRLLKLPQFLRWPGTVGRRIPAVVGQQDAI